MNIIKVEIHVEMFQESFIKISWKLFINFNKIVYFIFFVFFLFCKISTFFIDNFMVKMTEKFSNSSRTFWMEAINISFYYCATNTDLL